METIFSVKHKASQMLQVFTNFNKSPDQTNLLDGGEQIDLGMSYCCINSIIGMSYFQHFESYCNQFSKPPKINRSFFLNFISWCEGYKDWNHLSAILIKAPFKPTYILTSSSDGDSIDVSLSNESNDIKPLENASAIIGYLPVPDGFSWGYKGSGPQTSSLSILYDYFNDKQKAISHYIFFTVNYMAAMLGERKGVWFITGDEIDFFIANAKDPDVETLYLNERLKGLYKNVALLTKNNANV